MKHESTDRVVTKTDTIPAPVAKVWHAWTTNEGMQSWLVENTNIELKLGGKFEIYFGADLPEGSRGSELCTILSYAPQKMLSFTWNAPPTIPTLRAGGPCTWVVVNFTEIDATQTKIELTHFGIKSGAEDWDAYYAYFESAWGYVMQALKKHFE